MQAPDVKNVVDSTAHEIAKLFLKSLEESMKTMSNSRTEQDVLTGLQTSEPTIAVIEAVDQHLGHGFQFDGTTQRIVNTGEIVSLNIKFLCIIYLVFFQGHVFLFHKTISWSCTVFF